MRMRTSLLLVAVLACTMGQMCGAPGPAAPPDCLELDDVIGIPPGTGTGTTFSGTYRGLSAVEDSCLQCGRNEIPEFRCDPPTVLDGIFTVTQVDGVLWLDDAGASVTGRVDADGKFLVGGIITPTRDDGVKTGQVLMLMDGHFSDDLIIATMRWRITMQNWDGRTMDGEQVVTATMQKAQ